MRFARMYSPIIAAGAIAILACSDSRASDPGNYSASQSDGAVEEGTDVRAISVSDIARSLCIDRAGQRFKIPSADVTGHTFAGGGDTPQTIEGQVTLNLFGPPSRNFRCELAGGEITSIVEVDDNGDPVAARN